MEKHPVKNIIWFITFMVAIVSGAAAFCIVLANDLPAYITLPVLIYIASTVALWWFENGTGKRH